MTAELCAYIYNNRDMQHERLRHNNIIILLTP